jgi:hypothetical protein
MMGPVKLAGAVVLAGLVLVAGTARGEDVVAPSFKNSKDKDTKDFVTRVGTVIVKAARSRPQEIELDRYEYNKTNPGRRELVIRMTYTGKVSKLLKKKKYTATIKVKIDSSDNDSWEVLSIDYKDDNSLSLLSPSEKKVRKLIPQFNR